ncbi:imelysin family protein [Marinagarivorans algicola]|uniref:imelysin family protein n=1 Tax=Marinagarivorans algicola TaxID=1513270 RepID=UPI003735B3B0
MSRLIKTTLVLIAVAALASCDNSSIDNNELVSSAGSSSSSSDFSLIKKPFDYQSLLVNYADNVILPTYQAFELALTQLDLDINAQCDALDAQNVVAEPDHNVRQAFAEAVAVWQQAELMWVGPVTDNNNSLRNRIYSFATTAQADSCAIDITTVEHHQETVSLATRANTVRGLDALEYLIYESTLNTACSSAISQTAHWNALSQIARQQQRCHLSQAVTQDLLASSRELNRAWSNDGDNYRSLFINPNNAGPHLKTLSDAIFYLEKEVKDTKLGTPLAQTASCILEACPKAIEAPYAQNNGALIVQNLKTFKAMFNGSASNGANGIGFDDIIAYEGFAEVNVALNAKIDAAIVMAEQLNKPSLLVKQVSEQLSNKTKSQCKLDSMNAANGESLPASYCALHGLIQAINLQMRTDFVTIVNVDLPIRAQSDND